MAGLGEKRRSGRKFCTEFTDGKLYDPACGKRRSITGSRNKGIYQSIYEYGFDLSLACSKDWKYKYIRQRADYGNSWKESEAGSYDHVA